MMNKLAIIIPHYKEKEDIIDIESGIEVEYVNV